MTKLLQSGCEQTAKLQLNHWCKCVRWLYQLALRDFSLYSKMLHQLSSTCYTSVSMHWTVYFFMLMTCKLMSYSLQTWWRINYIQTLHPDTCPSPYLQQLYLCFLTYFVVFFILHYSSGCSKHPSFYSWTFSICIENEKELWICTYILEDRHTVIIWLVKKIISSQE